MKSIRLSSGQQTLVDDADYARLSQHTWCAQRRKNGFHAARYSGRRYIYMHREILGLTDPAIQGEHRDGNGLNNQRCNLRTATKAQNGQAFLTSRKGKTSRFRGVFWESGTGRWGARIQCNKVGKNLGRFESETVAAKAYDTAAKALFGEYAQPNFS